ncbi:MAG: nucleotide exchange factor GrpE [Bacteroidota bacterium]|nr:nucleotide exchange factor GrpE [Bacteroidota bacterium]
MEKNKYRGSNTEKENSEDTSINEMNASELEAKNSDINEPSAEENELTKLSQELEIQKDKYVRLFAEFDNFKRRNAKERVELMQTAGKEVITSMLEVLDDCDRAEKQLNSNDNIEQIKEGVQLIFNKLRNTLQAKGLKAMDSIDTDFDVHKHEAIAEVPVDDDIKKGKVIDEIVKGYYLNDKLIRFAKVVVGK